MGMFHLQEYLVDHPHVILPPPPPQPHHPCDADRAAETRHPDQRGVLHRVQHRVLHLAVLGALLQRLVLLDADECPRDDDEAREQDPGAEGCEEVVRARDRVEAEEHVHVAGLRCRLLLLGDCCWKFGSGGVIIGWSLVGFGWVDV